MSPNNGSQNCSQECPYTELEKDYNKCLSNDCPTEFPAELEKCILCQQQNNKDLLNDLSFNIDVDTGDFISNKSYSEFLDSNSNELSESFAFFYNKTIIEIVINVVGIILIAIIGSKKLMPKKITSSEP
jgi:hypothetical protein